MIGAALLWRNKPPAAIPGKCVELPAINQDSGGRRGLIRLSHRSTGTNKTNSQASFWSALYQCRPSSDEGDYFKVGLAETEGQGACIQYVAGLWRI